MLADDVLELLADNQWHDIEEIAQVLNQREEPIGEILKFYEKYDFVKFDSEKTKVVIDQKILELFL